MKNNDLICTRQSRPTRLASSPRVGLLVLSLLCALLMGASTPAQASHFRYGSLTWQTAPADPTGKTIVYKITQAFREDFFSPIPVVGGSEYTGDLSLGDGNFLPINLVVTSVDAPSNSFFGEATITHTYASASAITASYTSCCRLSSLQNNADESWHVFTNVKVGSFNNSPISTLPAVVNLPVGLASASFTVPGSDSSPLTFSLLPSGGLAPNANYTQAPGLSITPAGLASFSTAGLTVGDLYNAIVQISDGPATVMVDFIIRIVGTSNAPVFDYGPTPVDGSTIIAVAGVPMSFTVRAHDADAADVVGLQGTGLPLGSSFTSPSPANPVSSVFSWTPGVGDAGPHLLSFNAQDQVGAQALTSVTINVIGCNLSLSTSSSDVTCNGAGNGAINLTVAGAIGTPTYSWTGPGTFTAGTEDLTGLSPGTYTVVVKDGPSCQATTSVIIAQPVPVPTPLITPAATSPVFTGGPLTTIYRGYGPQTVQLTASKGDGNYSWAPSASLNTTAGATVIATPTATTTYTVTATNSAGCTATATITISVVDVRCGNKNDKVLVCHNGNGICISPDAVNTHLTSPGHHDVLGACPALRGSAPAASEALGAPTRLEAFPNPANGQATISFLSVEKSKATMRVYNNLGALVATLYDGTAEAGQRYSAELNSEALAEGIYYCRLVANGQLTTTRLMIVK